MKKKYLWFSFSIVTFFAFVFFIVSILAIQHHSISSYLGQKKEFSIERTIRINIKNLFLRQVDSLRKEEFTWMQEKIHEVIPDYDQLDDFEKVRRIREWVYSWTDLGHGKEMESRSSNFVRFQPIYSSYEGFEKNELAVYCAGTSMALYKVYRLLGFPARTYGFGFFPSKQTHVLTLVHVQGKEYIQDAFGNYEILDEKDKPLPFEELLTRLQNQRHDFEIHTRKQIEKDEIWHYSASIEKCSNKKIVGDNIVCKIIYYMDMKKYFREELRKRGLGKYHSLYALFFPLMTKNRQHYKDILREYSGTFTPETKSNINNTPL